MATLSTCISVNERNCVIITSGEGENAIIFIKFNYPFPSHPHQATHSSNADSSLALFRYIKEPPNLAREIVMVSITIVGI